MTRARRSASPLAAIAVALAVSAAAAIRVPAASPEGAAGVPIDPSFAADPVWDDGLAEVATYAAQRTIYGAARDHELTAILVKEDFADALHVKADPPYAGRVLTTVLKLNLVESVPTENYTYHFLTSVHVARADVTRLVKATAGIQEWCGNTFKEIVTWGGAPRLHYHSYFDGQGDGEQAVDLGPGALLDEQLLVVARAASLAPGAPARLRVLDPITSGGARPLASHDATLSAEGDEPITVPAGTFRARRLVLREGSRTLATYWVEASGPRALVRMESSDGRRLVLKGRVRRDYWSRPPVTDR
ncbi:MAG TPA: hypothetical protein VE404_00290 [Verrucomicrobiae bacterium]|nr:hypothetical protein [Verrucomicrobiae bacterium]